MPTGRIPNWDIALFRWAESVKGSEFKWGTTDCASLVRQAFTVMYGKDLFPHVSRWKSLRKAVRVLEEVEGIATLLRASGAVLVPLKFAQSGDVVCAPGLDDDNLPRLGMMVNGRVVMGRKADGVVVCPLSEFEEGTELWRMPNV